MRNMDNGFPSSLKMEMTEEVKARKERLNNTLNKELNDIYKNQELNGTMTMIFHEEGSGDDT